MNMRRMCFVFAGLLAWAAAAPAAPSIRIMPLGDSITDGSSTKGSYRGPLYQLLTAAGYNVDFVGTQTGNTTNTLPEINHEGHSGWRIRDLDYPMAQWFDQIADPDIILMLIGTNDYGANDDTPNATNRLDTLIDHITTLRPAARLVVANLLERGEPANTQITNFFNPVVPAIVAKYAALGRSVTFTDPRSAVPLSDMPDKLHPGLDGHIKMATNWFNCITNLVPATGATNPPALLRAAARVHLTNVVATLTNVAIAFNRAVTDDATNTSHYALNGGLGVLRATLDPVAQRDVTLITTPQAPSTVYAVTVNGVRERATDVEEVPSNSVATFVSTSAGGRGAFNNVPEAAEYALAYSVNIATSMNYSVGAGYDLDYHASLTGFSRVAYYLELKPASGAAQYAWVSMDPFTTNAARLGVPTLASGAFFQQPVSNLNVFSDVGGVVCGTNLSGGSLEFWPYNYTAGNASNVAGAGSTMFDWGDASSGSGNYGSMQIHNVAAAQTVLAFNNWGGAGGLADVGIGNRGGKTDPDWTHASNTTAYAQRLLQVYVLPTGPARGPALVSATGLYTSNSVVLQFDRPLADDATNLAYYALDGGLTVLKAELDPVTKLAVTLTTSAQTPGATNYVTVQGALHDRTAAATPLPQVYVLPVVNTNAPVLLRATATATNRVVLEFSTSLDDDATNLAYYALSGGLTVLRAELDLPTLATVTLTTSRQGPGLPYTVTVYGGRDRTPARLPVAVGSTASFRGLTFRGALNNVPESAGYTLVYSLDLPNTASYNSTGVAYQVDNHLGVSAFTRVAYYLELQKSGVSTDFLWVAMDPFTTNAGKLGVPCTAAGAVFQQPVSNMSVRCNVNGVVTGDSLPGGNIEFWPNDYSASNAAAVAGASNSTYDWGDVRAAAGSYGSMQIHNAGASQVLMAINHWGGGGTVALDVGIGNNTGAHPDYTFMYNAAGYSGKTLQVYVLPVADTNGPVLLRAAAAADLEHIVLTFDEPLADSAADPSCYTLSGGLAVLGATLGADLRTVTLLTSHPAPDGHYTVSVTGVRDRSAGANPIADAPPCPVASALPALLAANVPAAAGFQVVSRLNLPVACPGWNENGTPYDVDNRAGTPAFDRVGYYLELVPTNSPGVTNWIFAAMDPFTKDVYQIGVPDRVCGADFQQPVTNLDVYCNVAGVTNGTGLAGGTMEFWPFSYSTATNPAVPGSNSAYDWSDTQTRTTLGSGGHACMQLHLPPAGQVLFAMNHWGSAATITVGIGNNTNSTALDWTSMDNAAAFTVRNLYVLARPAPLPGGPLLTGARGSMGRTNVLVGFDRPLENAAAAPANFALSGGLAVSAATLRTNLHEVLLTTDPQAAGTAYTVTVNHVRDRTVGANPIAADSTVAFTAAPDLPLAGRVPESAGYELVYKLAIPGASPNWNSNAVVYALDQRGFLTQPFDRIAYCLELATDAAGPTNWVYCSANAFTRQLGRVGVPAIGSGAGFQQKLTNLNVFSSLAELQGTNLAGGNIEFWPYTYSAVTTTVATTGSTLLFDWNDTITTTAIGYGSMQIHCWTSNQVLFAYNNWGSTNTISEVGIGTNSVAQPDWTHAYNATNYAVKNLYVLVHPTNTPAAVAPPVLPPAIVMQPGGRTNQLGQAALFAAAGAGSGPLRYQWRRDGAPLDGQTNGWLALPGLSPADNGGYDLIVMNGAGSATSQVAVLSVNRPPVPPDFVFGTEEGQPLALSWSNLVAGATDPDDDAISWAGADTLSTNGAGVSAGAGQSVYTPLPGFAGADGFGFALADNRGGSATGQVRIVVIGANVYNRFGALGRTNGAWQAGFVGLPSVWYAVQRSTNLIDWDTVTNLPAASDGSVQFSDPDPPAAQGFYRTLAP